jgi:hypothetical protein
VDTDYTPPVMRTNGIALASVAAAALALVFAGIGAGSASSRHPALRLAKTSPLQIAGSRFRFRERVRVTVYVSDFRRARTVQASGTGSFVAAFSTNLDRCTEFSAVAVGNRGSRAVLKPLPQPACLPQ